MAYFVRIGPIPTNVSGVGARGYHAFRRGTDVVVIWGGVTVAPGRHFYWSQSPQRRTYQKHTVEAARCFLDQIAEERKRNKYSPLPRGSRIAAPQTA